MEVLKVLLLLLIPLNIIDIVLTLTALQSSSFAEANPLMRSLINVSPVLFILVKMLLISGGTWLAYKLTKRRLEYLQTITFFVLLVTALYCAVITHGTISLIFYYIFSGKIL